MIKNVLIDAGIIWVSLQGSPPSSSTSRWPPGGKRSVKTIVYTAVLILSVNSLSLIIVYVGIVSTSEFCEDVITRIPDRWRKFGIAVEIKMGVLNAKNREYMGNAEDIFTDVFEYWRENQAGLKYPVTWESVVKILRTRTVDEGRLADEIEEKYCKKTQA